MFISSSGCFHYSLGVIVLLVSFCTVIHYRFQTPPPYTCIFRVIYCPLQKSQILMAMIITVTTLLLHIAMTAISSYWYIHIDNSPLKTELDSIDFLIKLGTRGMERRLEKRSDQENKPRTSIALTNYCGWRKKDEGWLALDFDGVH